MKVAIIRAQTRDGYNGYWAGYPGRFWPSGSASVVEVVPDAFDPKGDGGQPSLDANGRPIYELKETEEGSKFVDFHSRQISERTLEACRAEKAHLTVEVRYVEKLDDVKLDQKTGLPVSEKESEAIENLKAEKERVESELQRLRDENAQLHIDLDQVTAPKQKVSKAK